MRESRTSVLGLGGAGRLSAALAILALSAGMATETMAAAFNSTSLQRAARRRRDYTPPGDSRVRNLANKEVRDWNAEVDRKKAARKGHR